MAIIVTIVDNANVIKVIAGVLVGLLAIKNVLYYLVIPFYNLTTCRLFGVMEILIFLYYFSLLVGIISHEALDNF